MGKYCGRWLLRSTAAVFWIIGRGLLFGCATAFFCRTAALFRGATSFFCMGFFTATRFLGSTTAGLRATARFFAGTSGNLWCAASFSIASASGHGRRGSDRCSSNDGSADDVFQTTAKGCCCHFFSSQRVRVKVNFREILSVNAGSAAET